MVCLVAGVSSGGWIKEHVRLQQELERVVAWVRESGLTDAQREKRIEAAKAIFNDAGAALEKALEKWAQELSTTRR